MLEIFIKWFRFWRKIFVWWVSRYCRHNCCLKMIKIKIDFLCDLIICLKHNLRVFSTVSWEWKVFNFLDWAFRELSHDVAWWLWFQFFKRSCSLKFLVYLGLKWNSTRFELLLWFLLTTQWTSYFGSFIHRFIINLLSRLKDWLTWKISFDDRNRFASIILFWIVWALRQFPIVFFCLLSFNTPLSFWKIKVKLPFKWLISMFSMFISWIKSLVRWYCQSALIISLCWKWFKVLQGSWICVKFLSVWMRNQLLSISLNRSPRFTSTIVKVDAFR